MAKKNPLIVALDVDSLTKAEGLVKELKGLVSLFKIGLQLFTREGPASVAMVKSHGVEVFLDLKFHDIPNTVARACESAARMGAFMMNVHASGGQAMMAAARDAVAQAAGAARRSRLLGVTVLTSDPQDAQTEARVMRLAQEAQASGLDGVVCSGHEIRVVRQACGKDFLLVVPGIRPAGSAVGDQRRVMTPKEALDAGADYLVMGRPILESREPAKKVQEILRDLSF